MKYKLFRITTVPISLKYLLEDQMLYMSKNGFDVSMISSDGPMLKEIIKTQKCKHYVVPLTRKITPFKDIKALYILFKILKKEKPHIVHTHTPKAGIIGMLASYLANVPIRLHTVAGLPLLESKGLKRILLNLVEKLTYKCSTKVYPNSQGLKNIILKNKYTNLDKLKVIGNGSSNGINTTFFDPNLFKEKEKHILKNKLGVNKIDFIFVYVGRIVQDKGINEMVEAFDIISSKANVSLLLVGPYEDELNPISFNTKKIINSNKKIISVGFQEDVRIYFAISNCLIFPSYREGFPNVVMQAGSMSLPCIVSDINGCNEIVENNTNGIIIPPKNCKAIYNSMLKVYKEENFYKKLKFNSRKIIKSKYERKLFLKLLLNEYQLSLNYHANS